MGAESSCAPGSVSLRAEQVLAHRVLQRGHGESVCSSRRKGREVKSTRGWGQSAAASRDLSGESLPRQRAKRSAVVRGVARCEKSVFSSWLSSFSPGHFILPVVCFSVGSPKVQPFLPPRCLDHELLFSFMVGVRPLGRPIPQSHWRTSH